MNDKFISILQNRFTIPTSIGVVALSGGLTAGYFWGKHKGVKDYVEAYKHELDALREEMMAEIDEIDSAQLELLDDDEQPIDELTIVIDDETIVVVEDPQTTTYIPMELEPVEVEELEPVIISEEVIRLPTKKKNVFDKGDDIWDYEVEKEQRNEAEPYVIHHKEYIDEEMGYRQETLTYYVVDDMLADPQEVAIYGWSTMLGDFIDKFGHGSDDPNVVYIRNETMETEWEILRHHGSYAVEVQGFQAQEAIDRESLQHSVRRFRDTD